MQHETDPHSEIRTTTQPCQVHGKHTPESHINHRHHIWPRGDGGPDLSDNVIVSCPTGHYNIHDLLAHYKMNMGKPTYTVLRRYSFGERKYAQLGWERMNRKSL